MASMPRRPFAVALAFAVALPFLSGCILSDAPVLDSNNTDLPFGDYTLLRQMVFDTDAQRQVPGGRVALRHNGAGYTIESIDKGAFAQYSGAFVLAKEIYSNGPKRLFILQARMKMGDSSESSPWMFLSLKYDGSSQSIFIKDYTEVTDCERVPDSLLAKLRASSVAGMGCTVATLSGISDLLRDDYTHNTLTDKGYSFKLVSSS